MSNALYFLPCTDLIFIFRQIFLILLVQDWSHSLSASLNYKATTTLSACLYVSICLIIFTNLSSVTIIYTFSLVLMKGWIQAGDTCIIIVSGTHGLDPTLHYRVCRNGALCFYFKYLLGWSLDHEPLMTSLTLYYLVFLYRIYIYQQHVYSVCYFRFIYTSCTFIL